MVIYFDNIPQDQTQVKLISFITYIKPTVSKSANLINIPRLTAKILQYILAIIIARINIYINLYYKRDLKKRIDKC